MSKHLFLSLVLMLLGFSSFAQSIIKGEVVDAKDNAKLSNATIMLIQAKDSILVDYTRATEEGKFQLKKPNDGNFLLIVSYPKYGDFFTSIAGNSETNDLKQVKLSTVEHLIEEVIVTGRIPIVIKGDTTEYDAGSFKVEKNAKVEDLLKVLPGITVDASGKITAQGKTVEKVLVDGEEFFGDDPVLVTRNIRSDMVDKVQVYDKKSDQTERTGVDDGVRTKTINVKLKENAKHGLFGKAEAGAGTDKFYLGQSFLNYFKQSLRMSAFVIASNNGKTSLSGNESTIVDGGEWGDGNYRGEGIPETINAGFFYSDKSKNDKHNWRLNYKYNQLNTEVIRNTFIQNSLRDTVLSSDYDSDGNNSNKRNTVNIKHESKFDSLTTLTIWAGVGNNNSENSSKSSSVTRNQFDQKINESERTFFGENKSSNFNASTMLTRKFSKKGRSLNFYYGMNGYDQDGNQIIDSKLKYYTKGVLTKDSTLNQLKETDNTAISHGVSLSYSEPLSKKLVGTVEYKLNNDKSSNRVESFNKDNVTGDYTDFDEEFSNDFDYNTFKNTYSLTFNYKPSDKFNFNISNFLEQSELKQTNNYNNMSVNRSFLVYAPNISANYQITKSKSLTLSYNGENSLPAMDQIQPLRSNVDPLNEYLGNENLVNAYTHNADLSMWASNILSGTYYGGGLSIRNTKDALIQNVITDGNGKNTYIWENLTNESNNSISLYGWYYTNLWKKHQIKHGFNPRASLSQDYNFMNGVLAEAISQSYSISYGWQKSTTKGVDFQVNLSPGYTLQKNSIREDLKSNGFTFGSEGEIKYYLPKKFQFLTSFNYIYQAATDTYKESFERLLINPEISKKFMKDETLMLTFAVNDLLNQNVGFSRNQSGTQLTERRYNTIGRYYMLKVSWEINKMFIKAN